MKVSLVIGPWGYSFEETVATARTTEERGFSSWYLGDHFFSVNQIVSLEPYLLFALAARETERIRIGPLVTPVMFRPPSNVGRLAAQLDILSGGRFVLGLGVGWHPGEHRTFGVDYPSLRERFDRLDEYIQVMQAMWGEGPASFEGRYYRLHEADTRPKPEAGRPTILIAGGGEKRTLPLVAKHAHEWNCVDLSVEMYQHKREVIAAACDDIGRDPSEIRDTMMTMGLIGATEEALEAEAALQMLRRAPPSPMSAKDYLAQQRSRSAVLMGSPGQIVDKIGRLGEAGVDEIIFIWFNLASTAMPDWLADNVLPQVGDL